MMNSKSATLGYTLKNNTDAVFLPTPGLPGYFQTNFDYQLVRAIGAETYGGAEVGECLLTAKRIEDGDIESFTQAWTDTAMRVEALAEASLKGGHPVSARGLFACDDLLPHCGVLLAPHRPATS
jgi:hypothetical protein